jgi:hypothetical protein
MTDENPTGATITVQVVPVLRDPFKRLTRANAVRVRRFDRVIERSRNAIYDEAEVRRARDWALLANQVVGLEDLAAGR